MREIERFDQDGVERDSQGRMVLHEISLDMDALIGRSSPADQKQLLPTPDARPAEIVLLQLDPTSQMA